MVTVDSRQSAIVNESREVITLESSLIESCPSTLPYKPFTQLTARLPGKGRSKIENWLRGQRRNVKYRCQFLYNNRAVASLREKCALPATAVGYVYVVITDSSTPVLLHDDSHIVAGPVLRFNGSRQDD
ncbi:hypothetical protein BG006_009123 [Podila minutissima]|uniref:Uncharacterized protein n=1 Tax=Podila minutissima TaxID=64525 RepID=A0A9P5SVF0_9FUNG|nr:hypothetical protein BG006_009123 [Podila minutissima]